MTRSRAACGCIRPTQSRTTALTSMGANCRLDLAEFELRQVEQVVGERQHVAAGGEDVAQVVAVALVADGAEPLLQHDLGEAEDRVQRRAHFVADARQQIRSWRRSPARASASAARALLGARVSPVRSVSSRKKSGSGSLASRPNASRTGKIRPSWLRADGFERLDRPALAARQRAPAQRRRPLGSTARAGCRKLSPAASFWS